MKIAFDGTVLHGRKSGVGYYCEELLNAMLEMNHDDQFFVFSHQRLDLKANVIHEWDDRPTNALHDVTQTPMPLHFNLWLFQGKPPKDGKPVEINNRTKVHLRNSLNTESWSFL